MIFFRIPFHTNTLTFLGMPPNPPSNSRLPRLAVWSGYGTVMVSLISSDVKLTFVSSFFSMMVASLVLKHITSSETLVVRPLKRYSFNLVDDFLPLNKFDAVSLIGFDTINLKIFFPFLSMACLFSAACSLLWHERQCSCTDLVRELVLLLAGMRQSQHCTQNVLMLTRFLLASGFCIDPDCWKNLCLNSS